RARRSDGALHGRSCTEAYACSPLAGPGMTTDEPESHTPTTERGARRSAAPRSAAGPTSLLGEDSISVVIPAFNEAERVARTLRETDAAMAAFGAPYEIVLVDDGSADDTIEHAKRAAAGLEHARLIRLDVNAGKGWALVRG